MTDKQIIIDGVDVSGCKKYEHEIIRCNTSLKNMCFYGGRCTDKKNADCYYKQLKHKEQEYEELKEEIKHYKQIAQYHGNLSVKYTNKSAKLKQTLTEIKNIAEKENNDTKVLYNRRTDQRMKQILQKISEVEDEHNG